MGKQKNKLPSKGVFRGLKGSEVKYLKQAIKYKHLKK